MNRMKFTTCVNDDKNRVQLDLPLSPTSEGLEFDTL